MALTPRCHCFDDLRSRPLGTRGPDGANLEELYMASLLRADRA